VHPLEIGDSSLLRGPLLAMLGALALPILLALPSGYLSRRSGGILLVAYVGFVAFVLLR